MRAPRIRIKHRFSLRLKLKAQKVICDLNKNTCIDIWNKEYVTDWRRTRSVSRFLNEFNGIIIYEAYRCMPLLGNEKINAPDWEEHVVRYCIVLIRKNS